MYILQEFEWVFETQRPCRLRPPDGATPLQQFLWHRQTSWWAESAVKLVMGSSRGSPNRHKQTMEINVQSIVALYTDLSEVYKKSDVISKHTSYAATVRYRRFM